MVGSLGMVFSIVELADNGYCCVQLFNLVLAIAGLCDRDC